MFRVNVADITYVQGDARYPRGSDARLIVQIVNDSAFTWGAGFSLALREAWPTAQRAFRDWAQQERRNLKLGNVHVKDVEPNLAVVSMIAQHGFGHSPTPRIRYSALKTCLEQLSKTALERNPCPQSGYGMPHVPHTREEPLEKAEFRTHVSAAHVEGCRRSLRL
jgi:hypothetical protein